MSKPRSNTVQILNPAPGGAQYTTRKSAQQFVRRGLAVFEAGDAAIRFLNQSRRAVGSRDGISGDFWWHHGKSGGMSQLLGTLIVQAVRKARATDRSI
jgi:hypothetical protein